MNSPKEVIHTQIWDETPEPDNPFTASACYCRGYDVYGDLLGKASFIEYLYLLFVGDRPTPDQAKLLEHLALVLANPGPELAEAYMITGVPETFLIDTEGILRHKFIGPYDWDTPEMRSIVLGLFNSTR